MKQLNGTYATIRVEGVGRGTPYTLEQLQDIVKQINKAKRYKDSVYRVADQIKIGRGTINKLQQLMRQHKTTDPQSIAQLYYPSPAQPPHPQIEMNLSQVDNGELEDIKQSIRPKFEAKLRPIIHQAIQQITEEMIDNQINSLFK